MIVLPSSPVSGPRQSSDRVALLTVIPVFNGERYIAKTLRSLADQTRKPDRLVVLDNCSTDRTEQIVAEFQGLECEWRQNEHNLGLFGNLNRALEFAPQTDYLHVLHADDLIKPTYYERCVSVSRDIRTRALIYCASELVDENDQPFSHQCRTGARGSVRCVPAKQFLVGRAELRPLYFPGMLLKTAGQSLPCRFRLDMPQLADQVFWGELSTHCPRIMEVTEPLSQYRFHQDSGTTKNSSSLDAWVLDEWRAMCHLASLIPDTRWRKWLRLQKLKCIFACRSLVKVNQVGGANSDFAAEIERRVTAIVGAPYWNLAKIVVKALR
jgi:glycosyltransferase involved in cell wall biosynthesis